MNHLNVFRRRLIVLAAIHFVVMSAWIIAIGTLSLGYGFSDDGIAKDSLTGAFIVWNIFDFPMGLSILLAKLGDSWALLGWILQAFVSVGWSWFLLDIFLPRYQRMRSRF